VLQSGFYGIVESSSTSDEGKAKWNLNLLSWQL